MAQPWRCVSATISLSLPYKTMHLHPLPPPHTHTPMAYLDSLAILPFFTTHQFTCDPHHYHTNTHMWPSPPSSYNHASVILPFFVIDLLTCDPTFFVIHSFTVTLPTLIIHSLTCDPPLPHHALTHLWSSSPLSYTHSLVTPPFFIIHSLICDSPLIHSLILHPLIIHNLTDELLRLIESDATLSSSASASLAARTWKWRHPL